MSKKLVRRENVVCEIYVVKLPESVLSAYKITDNKIVVLVNEKLDDAQKLNAIRQLCSGE